jgi:hypothetical protein
MERFTVNTSLGPDGRSFYVLDTQTWDIVYQSKRGFDARKYATIRNTLAAKREAQP